MALRPGGLDAWHPLVTNWPNQAGPDPERPWITISVWDEQTLVFHDSLTTGSPWWATHDGGATWERLDPGRCAGVDEGVSSVFIDAEHGWLWSRYGFAHTDDGGRSWLCLTYPRSYGREEAGGVVGAKPDHSASLLTPV